MPRFITLVFTSLALMMPFTVSARAQDIITTADPHTVLKIAQQFGIAILDTDSAGDPIIGGEMDGQTYVISFYGCSNNRDCKQLLLTTVWEDTGVSLRAVNDWNSERLFGRAYINGDQDLFVEFGFNLDFGITIENLTDNIDWFKVLMSDAEQQLVN